MKTINKISKHDINEISTTINELINYSIDQQPFLNIFSTFLENSIHASNFKSQKTRLDIINFLDKVNRYKEFKMIESGELKVEDLEKMAERFGRKAQSGFETSVD